MNTSRSTVAARLGWLVNILTKLLLATRPKQWPKNLLIFLPLVFTANDTSGFDDAFYSLETVGKAVGAFVAFCALSGGVYICNDIFDVERDRAHPIKRYRPLASGQLPIPLAVSAAAALMSAALVVSFWLTPQFGAIGAAYVISQLAYSIALKAIPILDVFLVSSGFLFRVASGAVVLPVPISAWLYLCTGLGGLFIAISKRRSELATAGELAGVQRDTLRSYTLGMLDQMATVAAACALVSYALYTFTAENLPANHAMMLTIPFVGYGLFRYMFLVHVRGSGENPEDILVTDGPLIATVVLWLVISVAILVSPNI